MSPKYVIEFIGTFFLVLVIAFGKNPIATAGILMAVVYLGGYISGAHYNPAVSIAVFLQKKIDTTTLVKYIATQIIAAMLASFTYLILTRANFYISPGEGSSFGTAVLAEMLFTFVLCTVVLHTAVSEKTKGNSYFGLAIGATVGVAGLTIGNISGAALNPAVGIGPLLIDFNLLKFAFSYGGIYIIGPISGAVLASLVYTITNKKS